MRFSSKVAEIYNFTKSLYYYSASSLLFSNIKQYECYFHLSFTIPLIPVFSNRFLFICLKLHPILSTVTGLNICFFLFMNWKSYTRFSLFVQQNNWPILLYFLLLKLQEIWQFEYFHYFVLLFVQFISL